MTCKRKSCKCQRLDHSRLRKEQMRKPEAFAVYPGYWISFLLPRPFFVLQHFSFGQSLISAQLESFLFLPFWPLPLPICPAIQQPLSKKSSRSKDRKKLGETYYGFKNPEHTRRGFLSHLPGAFDRIPDSRLWSQLLSSLHHYEHQGGRDQPRRGKQLSCVRRQILTWKPMA